MRASRCKNPSDRVYTAHAVARPPSSVELSYGADAVGTIDLIPDYTKTYLEVYNNWTRAYISQRSELDFLLHCTPLATAGLPSWVPDWSRKRDVRHHMRWSLANGSSRSAVIAVDHKHLTVKGVLANTMQHAYAFSQSRATRGFTDTAAALNQLVQAALPYIEDDHQQSNIFLRLCLALCCGQVSSRFESTHPEIHPIEQLQSTLEAIMSSQTDLTNLSAHQQNHIESLTGQCHGRALITSENGSIGLGPQRSQQNDTTVVLLGCCNPLVLRPQPGGTYQVLGEAYLENTMDGEAVLGPLAPSYRVVYAGPGNTLIQRFVNDESGDWTMNDPRLPALSEEWEDVTIPHDGITVGARFQHRRSGEMRWHYEDPRCDVEALEARGVKLKEFTLV